MATTRSDLPALIRPMLATTGPLPSSAAADEDWAYELKWDGVRAVAYVGVRGGLRLLSRADLDMTGRYPELAPLGVTGQGPGRRPGGPVVLDGEIVTFRDGRPSFSRLQQRMQVRLPSAELVAAVPVVYLIFDVLHHGGRSLLPLPYGERRDVLDRLDLTGPTWQTPPAWFGGGADVLAASRERGLEGVVAKRTASTYRPGARSRDWIKTKNIRVQSVVIGGWTVGEGRRAGSIGSLLLGIPDPADPHRLAGGAGLRYVGHVGTGFTAAVLVDLARRLAPLAQDRSPFTAGGGVPREHARGAHWVTPAVIGEVTHAEWTPDGVLRHPSWRGYRPDQRLEDVVRE